MLTKVGLFDIFMVDHLLTGQSLSRNPQELRESLFTRNGLCKTKLDDTQLELWPYRKQEANERHILDHGFLYHFTRQRSSSGTTEWEPWLTVSKNMTDQFEVSTFTKRNHCSSLVVMITKSKYGVTKHEGVCSHWMDISITCEQSSSITNSPGLSAAVMIKQYEFGIGKIEAWVWCLNW